MVIFPAILGVLDVRVNVQLLAPTAKLLQPALRTTLTPTQPTGRVAAIETAGPALEPLFVTVKIVWVVPSAVSTVGLVGDTEMVAVVAVIVTVGALLLLPVIVTTVFIAAAPAVNAITQLLDGANVLVQVVLLASTVIGLPTGIIACRLKTGVVID